MMLRAYALDVGASCDTTYNIFLGVIVSRFQLKTLPNYLSFLDLGTKIWDSLFLDN